MNYTIELIDKKIAKELIIENHYSHKWTSCRYALGLFTEGNLVGVAVYGFPVGRSVVKSITPDLENGDVLELTRLWVADSEGKNTESHFLGKTFWWLKKNTDVKILISYSDPMQGHVGGIYQATNWLYQGNNTMLAKAYDHYMEGEWMHSRTVVAKYGSIKVEHLKKIYPEYKRRPILKKHRYLYPLVKGKEREEIINNLKHPILPYPKNNDNCEW